ncbi:hypothetical protein [Catellatospora citrea]|uniref:Uncharacterized protein n=1 Tax=Catellatospora citrea TaxID=53366 RepID=A0A8J3KFN5_9ACTN|nr:hypothetical protein [Catellatospora citrea]RKE07611.1 hypothetical protein C8E86_2442 [Catellatospora citrea]GIF99196.1 hypothetical protein Cci01nite_42900 [Catellatospora citrea]
MPPIDAPALLATLLADVGGPLMGLAGAHAAPLAGSLQVSAAPAAGKELALAGAAFFAVLTVALTVWLHKKIKPERLTPANAHLIHTDGPTQPGGAPSA